jgi:hypothetical protein
MYSYATQQAGMPFINHLNNPACRGGGEYGHLLCQKRLEIRRFGLLFQEKVASGINIILQHERGLQEARLIVLSYFRRDNVLPPWSGGSTAAI